VLCTVYAAIAITIPLHPYPLPPHVFPLLFPILFSFLLLSGFCIPLLQCLASPFYVVQGASSLTCLHHYRRNIKNGVSQFSSKCASAYYDKEKDQLKGRALPAHAAQSTICSVHTRIFQVSWLPSTNGLLFAYTEETGFVWVLGAGCLFGGFLGL